MRHCVKRTLCVLVSISVLLTLISVFTLSTTASSASSPPTISVGNNFMIAQTNIGEIWGWGDNSTNVLGTALEEGTGDTNIKNPVKIDLPGTVTSKAISAGFDHVLALGSDGNVYAWGKNEHGQLGIAASETPVTTPTLVEGLHNKNVKAIAAGRYFSLALTDGGDVYSFGINTKLQLGYELAEESHSATPTLISDLDSLFITQISAGYDSAAAQTSDGKVYLWGSTENCILGINDSPTEALPFELSSVLLTTTIHTAVLSQNHSAFLLNDGTVAFYGNNQYGQYGNGTTNPEDSKKFKVNNDATALNITTIAISHQQTVVLSANGKVYTAGARLPNDADTASNTFVALVDGAGQMPLANTIAAGYQNGAMIAQDGSVWTWGDNSCGQLGKGTASDASATPVKVMQNANTPFDLGNHPFVKDVPMVFKTTVPSPSYAVVIPSSDADNRYATKEGFTIEANNVTNLLGKEIVVTVEPGEGDIFYLYDGNETYLPFDILTSADSQTPIQSGEVLARFSQDGSVQTWIRVDQSLISKSGIYNGVLTFRYSVVDSEN